MRSRPKLDMSLHALVAVFLILATGIGASGFSYYADHKEEIKRQNYDQLNAVAELKVAEIARWRGARLARLEDSLALVNETVTCIRGMMTDLRPPLLDDYGLAAVLRWYCREFSARSGIDTVVECNEQHPRFRPPAEIALFRIAQEALTNTMKHARAGKVTVSLEATAELVRMTIADDGGGFSPRDICGGGGQSPCWGMLGMRARAEMIGGHLLVQSCPAGGTGIVVEARS